MAWRGIHLSRSAYLSIEHRVLKLDFRDNAGGSFHHPLEDLAYIILDTQDITLSGRLLASLSENDVLVLGVNGKHLPVWTSLPWTRFHRQGEVLKIQLDSTVPLRKQIWSYIVRAKIIAQAQTLAHYDQAKAAKLRQMEKTVRSGDSDNVEARAARFYWQSLFKNREFRRHDDDLPNAMLNYAYALIRAALARNLSALGFVPQIGLHHESLSNAYNLADDLIEPYRPLADAHALTTLGDQESTAEFTTEHRRSLALLLESEVTIKGEVFSFLPAIELTCASLKIALREKASEKLVFPDP